MKLVTTEDAQLRCEHSLRPGAPALLLLNPLGTSLEIWDDSFPALCERYEVVRYDMRGHGESTTGSKTELTMEQLARDALAVLDACGIARAHLCGLVDRRHDGHADRDALGRIACSRSPCAARRRTCRRARPGIRESKPCAHRESRRSSTASCSAGSPTPYRMAHPEKVEWIRSMLLTVKPQGYVACAAAIRDMDQRQSIKTITAKTLVIGGTQDPGTTPADHALIAASIPGAQLVMLEAAHLLHIERQAEFTETLLQFLAA